MGSMLDLIGNVCTQTTTTSSMPYQQQYPAGYASVNSGILPCSPIQLHFDQPPLHRNDSPETIVEVPSPERAVSPETPNDHWRFHYVDLDTMYPSISPKQMPDLRGLGLEVPRRSLESQSVPWEVVKHEHSDTGRSSPSSLQTVTTSIVSHVAAWKLEIAGLVLALGSMASFIALVARFSDKPLASWPSEAITLNALIAVLATVATAGMSIAVASGMGQMKWVRFKQGRAPLSDMEYFDEASRGALGALGLLFRMRGGYVSF